MHLSKNYSKSLLFVVFAAVLLIFTSLMWWQKDYFSSDRVFRDMLANNLNTYGYTKIIDQKNDAQKYTEKIQAFYGPTNGVYSTTSITKKENGKTTSRVKTETIGNTKDQRARYIEITTDLKDDKGTIINFNDLVNAWASQDLSNGSGLYAGSKYGIVPFGFLTQPQRNELINFIAKNDVYTFKKLDDVPDVNSSTYVYKVLVNQKAQIEMNKKYAELTGDKSLASINADQYADQKDIEVQFYIDKYSRQLKKVRYMAVGISEEYAGYGISKNLKLPNATVSTEELQSKLSERAAKAKRE